MHLIRFLIFIVIGLAFGESVVVLRRRYYNYNRPNTISTSSLLSPNIMPVNIRPLSVSRIPRMRREHQIPEGKIKLVGGRSNAEGNVEIYHFGRWGSICDDEWDMSEANVVCKSLGFPLGGLTATDNSFFGRGRKLIWMDNLYCNGNESSLVECQFDGWKMHDCGTNEVAGVVCKTKEQQESEVNNIANSIENNESAGSINNNHNRNAFTLGNSNSNDAPISFDHSYFSSTRIRSVIKEDINIRLSGGRNSLEGRVEVNVNDRGWGLICGDGWGILEAMVVCRQLKLGYAQHALQTSAFRGHNESMEIGGVRCKGYENNIADCSMKNVGSVYCPGREENIAGVICTHELPDLVPDEREIERSAYLEDKPLLFLQCAMEENCLSSNAYTLNRNEHGWLYETRRLLRFTARIGNIGTADFKPFLPKQIWDWHACHRHYHSMEVFAHFDILNSEGKRVAEGHKASFCLEDNSCEQNIVPKFKCANYGDQGISVGCTDTYLHNIDCQWIDITDLTPGTYQLKISINPEFKVSELNYDNNAALCTFYYNSIAGRVWNCTLTRP